MLRSRTALLASVALLGSLFVLAACADSWPDSLDPSDWYATSVGEEAAPRSDEPVPGADQDFPNLAEVPEAPTNVSTPEEIDQVAQSLAADLANAQYSGNLQRSDDETAPEAMPLPQPEPAVAAEDTTYIEPGGEIDIAAEQVMPEPVAETSVVEDAVQADEAITVAEVPAPPAESAEAVETAAVETTAVAMAEQPQPEPMEMADGVNSQSRVETDTIRDDNGELVGTVTRVVTSREVVVDANGQPVASQADAAPAIETEQIEVAAPAAMAEPEPAMPEPAMETEVAVAQDTMEMATPPAETAAVAVVPEPAPAAETVSVQETSSGGGSLVAQSEMDAPQPVVSVPQDVVVVPEYAEDLAIAQVQPVTEQPASAQMTVASSSGDDAMATMAESAAAAPAAAVMAGDGKAISTETRVQQETVVDNATGEVVGSVTRTVAVVETAHEVPTGTTAEEPAMAEPTMTVDDIAESLLPAEETTVAEEPAKVVTVPAQELDFSDLLSASGPGAGTQTQPIVIATAEPVGTVDAAFTTPGAGAAAGPEVLAAIIRFGDGSTALGAAERDIVRQLALIHADRGGKIRLVGHASKPAGGMETADQQLVNFNISLDRAVAVAEELIRQGVPRADVVVEAAGDSQASTDAAQDRRVDVLFGA